MAFNQMKRKRPQFSLRMLLVITAASAIGMAVYLRQSRVRSIIVRLQSLGGTIQYVRPGPDWFHHWTSDFFASPIAIDLQRKNVGEGDLDGIGELRGLTRLYLARTKIKDSDVKQIAECKNLERLSLYGCRRLSEHAIDSLCKLTKLQVLDLHDTRI